MASKQYNTIIAGPWSDPTTWIPPGVPTAADDVDAAGGTIALDVNATCLSFVGNNSGTDGGISHASGSHTLTVGIGGLQIVNSDGTGIGFLLNGGTLAITCAGQVIKNNGRLLATFTSDAGGTITLSAASQEIVLTNGATCAQTFSLGESISVSAGQVTGTPTETLASRFAGTNITITSTSNISDSMQIVSPNGDSGRVTINGTLVASNDFSDGLALTVNGTLSGAFGMGDGTIINGNWASASGGILSGTARVTGDIDGAGLLISGTPYIGGQLDISAGSTSLTAPPSITFGPAASVKMPGGQVLAGDSMALVTVAPATVTLSATGFQTALSPFIRAYQGQPAKFVRAERLTELIFFVLQFPFHRLMEPNLREQLMARRQRTFLLR